MFYDVICYCNISVFEKGNYCLYRKEFEDLFVNCLDLFKFFF